MKDQKEVRVVLPVVAFEALKRAATLDNRPLRSYLRVRLLELAALKGAKIVPDSGTIPDKIVPVPRETFLSPDLGAADCPDDPDGSVSAPPVPYPEFKQVPVPPMPEGLGSWASLPEEIREKHVADAAALEKLNSLP